MPKYLIRYTDTGPDEGMECEPHPFVWDGFPSHRDVDDPALRFCQDCECYALRTWHTPPPRKRAAEKTIQQKFEEFHAKNPDVYNSLEALAAVWFMHGHPKCGVGMLWERLRWESGMQPIDQQSVYRLSNSYRSRYVRLLVERNPEWARRFVTRELRAA